MTATIWVFAIIGMIVTALMMLVLGVGLAAIGLAALGDRLPRSERAFTSYNT
jgi:hypothetical protein